MKKRTFILFEILIAFFLVAIAAIPLMTQPLKLYRAELKHLEQIERERLADWTFTEIKEKLLKNEIPWQKIPTKNNKTSPLPLPPATLSIPGIKPHLIQRTYTLHCRGEKTGLQDETYRSIHIRIDFTPNPTHYNYRLTLRKL